MDDTQLIAETIQPGDYGMLVDLKDAYLTLSLHPSHRKYCRFRHPQTGRRLQWRTLSFGIAEAPRICIKLLRPYRARSQLVWPQGSTSLFFPQIITRKDNTPKTLSFYNPDS